MLDENIQRLEWWISSAFQLYYKSLPATLYNLTNLSFQKDIPQIISQAVVSTSKKSTFYHPEPGIGLHLL